MELTDEMWDEMMLDCATRTREMFEGGLDDPKGIEAE